MTIRQPKSRQPSNVASRHAGDGFTSVSAGDRAGLASGVAGAPTRAIEHLSIDKLKPHPANARTHSKKQIRQIANSFGRFGFNGVVIVNAANTIIAGHGRVEAARSIGLNTVPCVRVTHLSAAEERAYVLADNKIALNAGWDRSKLAIELEGLTVLLPSLDEPLDIGVTGFEPGEIDALMLDHIDADADPADEWAAPTAEVPVTRKGDLWLLGPHKILCADAREPSSYEALLDGQLADMVIVDMPFNVRVDGHVSGRGKTKHDEFAFASGEMSDAEFRTFLKVSLRRHSDVSRDGALIYAFMDWRHLEDLCAAGREIGLVLVNVCVWNKTSPGQGSHYRSAHELIAVFRKPGAPSLNNISLGRYGRSRTNVWTYASPNKFRGAGDLLADHPTPKPVGMIAEAIKDATARRGLVLDGFLGSGTTVLAAEKVGRVGLGIEFEPKYCDLSILRWQQYTGLDAILGATGATFEEVQAERSRGAGFDDVTTAPAQPEENS